MQYVIGKFGQKVIFNRKSDACNRSNTNGNVGAYTFFNLLIEMNPNDKFVFIGDSDLEDSEYLKQHKNLSINVSDLDNCFGIIMVGINYDESMMNILVKNSIRYVVVNDDERCLDAFKSYVEEFKISNLPSAIYGQSTKEYKIQDVSYVLQYMPVEKTVLYKSKMTFKKQKTSVCSVIANKSGKEYDRLQIVKDIVKSNYPVYGRLDDKQYPSNFKGEVKYDEVEKILQSSISTLLVPVRPGCMTSKWVEAILQGCIPIFYKDYPFEYTGIREPFVVSSENDLKQVLEYILRNEERYQKYVDELQNLLSIYLDGKLLNEQIMSMIKGGLYD